MENIILGYWNIRGYGATIRYTLEAAGVAYTDKIYDANATDEWFR